MVARGTTPTFVLSFTEQDLNLTQADNVYVTFASAGWTLTKTGEDLNVEEKQISIWLSQEETLSFCDMIEIQANWTSGDNRAASEVVEYSLSKQLLREVVE